MNASPRASGIASGRLACDRIDAHAAAGLKPRPTGVLRLDYVALDYMNPLRLCVAALLFGTLAPSWLPAQTAPDPLSALEATLATAEESLRQGEFQIAESQYRSALMLGWMLIGGLPRAPTAG
jgi:hypothetical protein